ncbi:hypothetical protein [Cellulomonas sp. ICMP 17802]|uniref:hypothetical protein n=1 Tax=Cellulomonas sp. ICMP 17802 TaxID=3239199 RepID=UPI00351B929A
MDEAPLLRQLRSDLHAMDDPHGAEARALRLVVGWAEHGERVDGLPFTQARVHGLVTTAVQRLTDESVVFLEAGETVHADAARRSASALEAYL